MYTLLVYDAGGDERLKAFVDRLSRLGANIETVSSPEAFERALSLNPWLSLVCIDGWVGPAMGERLIRMSRALQPKMPILWLTDMTPRTAPTSCGCMPEAVVPYDLPAGALSSVLGRLLRHSMYPDEIIELLETSVQDTMRDGFCMDLERHGQHVTATDVDMARIGAALPFSGPVLSGSIAISAGDATLAKMIDRGAQDEAQDERLTDLAGEIGNIVLGRVKHALDQRGLGLILGTPSPQDTTGKSRGPALVLQFGDDAHKLFAKLTVEVIDHEQLEAAEPTECDGPVALDEITFL